MRSLCKPFFILSLVTLSLSKGASCQYVQPMGYKDYSFWDQVNIGNKGTKLTHASAYLELGNATNSKRGFLLPRGNKDSIVSPAYGLMIYNRPDSLMYWYDGAAWRTSSAGSGANNYPTSLGYASNVFTLTRSGLPDLTVTLPFSSKVNVTDTTGKWVGMVYRRGDSLFYKKGTTEYFAAKFENTWPGLSSDYMAGDGSVVDFAAAVQDVGNTLYSPIGHTQPFSTITDGATAVRNLFGATPPLSYNPLTGNFSMSGTTAQDGLISGGIVTWSGSGLVFDVTASSYVIGGSPYNSLQSQVTLDPADATYGRYDVIAVDNTGHATKITGTPAASPVIPQIDPANQIYLTTVFIAAGATTPTQVSNEVIYDENTEWSHSTSGSVTANFASTAFASNGTKSISTTWTSASNLIFTNGSTLLSSNYTTVSFYIRLNNNLANNTNVSLQFYNSANPVSNQVAASFSKTTTSSWQLVSFNISQFSFTSSQFNSLRLILTGSTVSSLTTTTVYFDYIRLQAGLTPPPSVQGLQSAYSKITDGTNTATAAGSDVFKIRTDNTLSAVVANNDVTNGDNAIFKIDTTVIATRAFALANGGSGGIWGSITGTLSSQTDLQTALNAKVTANGAITGATKTKITYDSKGLVTAGADATTSDIAEGTNKYYTDSRAKTAISLSKNITIESPSSSENIAIWYSKDAITITQVADAIRGSSPSVDYQINFASARDSGSPTTLFSSSRTVSSTSGSTTTTFANASIPAGSWIWITTSATSGTVTSFAVTLTYTLQ